VRQALASHGAPPARAPRRTPRLRRRESRRAASRAEQRSRRTRWSQRGAVGRSTAPSSPTPVRGDQRRCRRPAQPDEERLAPPKQGSSWPRTRIPAAGNGLTSGRAVERAATHTREPPPRPRVGAIHSTLARRGPPERRRDASGPCTGDRLRSRRFFHDRKGVAP
jgi:hypothetical protein